MLPGSAENKRSFPRAPAVIGADHAQIYFFDVGLANVADEHLAIAARIPAKALRVRSACPGRKPGPTSSLGRFRSPWSVLKRNGLGGSTSSPSSSTASREKSDLRREVVGQHDPAARPSATASRSGGAGAVGGGRGVLARDLLPLDRREPGGHGAHAPQPGVPASKAVSLSAVIERPRGAGRCAGSSPSSRCGRLGRRLAREIARIQD